MIDADALLKRMQNDPLFDLVERYGVSGVINAEPTVDTEPIIETTLIVRKMDCIEELKCDKCRMVWLWSGDLFSFNYCPYCGAKVVGKRYKKEREEE